MPKLRTGEKESAYIKRYMKSDYSADKPTAQRLAIAHSEFKKQRAGKKRKRSRKAARPAY